MTVQSAVKAVQSQIAKNGLEIKGVKSFGAEMVNEYIRCAAQAFKLRQAVFLKRFLLFQG